MLDNYGYWERYDRVLPEDHPLAHAEKQLGRNVIWMRNAQGVDWYDFQKTLPTVEDDNDVYASVRQDPIDGKFYIASCEPHWDRIMPLNMWFVRLPSNMPYEELRGCEIDMETGDIIGDQVLPVTKVTAAQAKVALFRRGLYAQVEAAVAAMPFDVQLWFKEAREWERSNPYVMGFAVELDFTDEQVDELFVYASELSA